MYSEEWDQEHSQVEYFVFQGQMSNLLSKSLKKLYTEVDRIICMFYIYMYLYSSCGSASIEAYPLNLVELLLIFLKPIIQKPRSAERIERWTADLKTHNFLPPRPKDSKCIFLKYLQGI